MVYNVGFVVMLSVKLATCNCIVKQSMVGLTTGKKAAISRQNYRNHANYHGLPEFGAKGYFPAAQPAVGLK